MHYIVVNALKVPILPVSAEHSTLQTHRVIKPRELKDQYAYYLRESQKCMSSAWEPNTSRNYPQQAQLRETLPRTKGTDKANRVCLEKTYFLILGRKKYSSVSVIMQNQPE